VVVRPVEGMFPTKTERKFYRQIQKERKYKEAIALAA
jgi:hypothetical protein